MRNGVFLCGELGRFATLSEDVPAPGRAAPVSAATKNRMLELGAKHGLTAAQQAEPSRLAVVQKLIEHVPVTLEEYEALVAGGVARPDAAAIARAFPGVAAHRFYR